MSSGSTKFSLKRDGTIAFCTAGLFLALTLWTIFSPATLYPLTAEDGPMEYAQFGFYLIGAFCFFLFWRKERSRLNFGGALVLVWVLALLIIAGEEISWGQRIFGFDAPDIILSSNRQAEFNIHNLDAVYSIYGSDSKPMLFIELGLGVFLPLFAFTRLGVRLCRYFSMPVPPMALIPLFLGANIYGRLFAQWFLDLDFERTATPEIAEFLLSVALFAATILIAMRPAIAFGQSGTESHLEEKRME